jgi:hypothetical protein
MSAVGKLIEIYQEILSFRGNDDEISIANPDSDGGDDDHSHNNDSNDNNGDDNDSNNNDSDSNDNNGYKSASTPMTTHGVKRQHSGPSRAASCIVRRRYFDSPQAETAAAATVRAATPPLALHRGCRPVPFPILSPLHETFEL